MATTVRYPHNTQPVSLSRVTEIRDNCVTFERCLLFRYDVDLVLNSALRALGVGRRVSKELKNQRLFSVLCTSVTRSLLECAAIVWNGTCHIDSLRIDGVKTIVLSFLRYSTSVLWAEEVKKNRGGMLRGPC